MDAHSPHDYLKDVALGTSIIAVSFKGIEGYCYASYSSPVPVFAVKFACHMHACWEQSPVAYVEPQVVWCWEQIHAPAVAAM